MKDKMGSVLTRFMPGRLLKTSDIEKNEYAKKVISFKKSTDLKTSSRFFVHEEIIDGKSFTSFLVR